MRLFACTSVWRWRERKRKRIRGGRCNSRQGKEEEGRRQAVRHNTAYAARETPDRPSASVRFSTRCIAVDSCIEDMRCPACPFEVRRRQNISVVYAIPNIFSSTPPDKCLGRFFTTSPVAPTIIPFEISIGVNYLGLKTLLATYIY